VTADSAQVAALVGEVAPYVKPEPVQQPVRGGGRSQGANAQRKRAAREQGAGAGGGRGGQRAQGAGGGRGGQRAQGAGHARSDHSAGHSRSAQPAQGNPRTPGRRASTGGAGKLMVGSVVRQNGGNRRTGR
jgi:hypothetical protein